MKNPERLQVGDPVWYCPAAHCKCFSAVAETPAWKIGGDAHPFYVCHLMNLPPEYAIYVSRPNKNRVSAACCKTHVKRRDFNDERTLIEWQEFQGWEDVE